MWRSLPQTETAFTSIRTSSSLTFGSGTSRISIRPFPFPYFTTAFIFHLLIVALPFNWDDILRVSKLNGHGSQNLPPAFADLLAEQVLWQARAASRRQVAPLCLSLTGKGLLKRGIVPPFRKGR